MWSLLKSLSFCLLELHSCQTCQSLLQTAWRQWCHTTDWNFYHIEAWCSGCEQTCGVPALLPRDPKVRIRVQKSRAVWLWETQWRNMPLDFFFFTKGWCQNHYMMMESEQLFLKLIPLRRGHLTWTTMGWCLPFVAMTRDYLDHFSLDSILNSLSSLAARGDCFLVTPAGAPRHTACSVQCPRRSFYHIWWASHQDSSPLRFSGAVC